MTTDSLRIQTRRQSLRFEVRVQPRASRDEITGLLEGALKVRLGAPPVENQANKKLLRFLSSALRIPRRNLLLVGGKKSRLKTLEVSGLSLPELRARIDKILYNQ